MEKDEFNVGDEVYRFIYHNYDDKMHLFTYTVTRVTNCFYWIENNFSKRKERIDKRLSFPIVFKTKEEAFDNVLKEKERGVESAKQKVETALYHLDFVIKEGIRHKILSPRYFIDQGEK